MKERTREAKDVRDNHRKNNRIWERKVEWENDKRTKEKKKEKDGKRTNGEGNKTTNDKQRSNEK